MEKFIRLDMKGHWRGKDHVSSHLGMAGEWDDELGKSSWEKGISCYSLKHVALAVENLRKYWTKIACMNRASDYADFQVTIFEGEKTGMGMDWEDTAICENTLVEADAEPFMTAVFEANECYENEEISESEYHQILENLIYELMQNER
jgi:hypothetical protein